MTGEEIVEVYADGAVRETPWFERYGDVDAAVAVLRLGGGALAILSGTRHDPLGYDVRLEVFGTADSIAVGVDARARSARSSRARRSTRSAGYRNFLERFAPAYRAELAAFVDAVRDRRPEPVRARGSARRAPRRPCRRPLARRAASGRDRGGG